MTKLGINSRDGLVIEEACHRSHLIWPTPTMSAANFFDAAGEKVATLPFNADAPYYFREDTFDPVSRIRQGRFYKFNGRVGGGWRVNPHPLVSIPYTNLETDGTLNVGSLAEYDSWELTRELDRQQIGNLIVQLGNETASTLWHVIHLETGFTGEQLVTLKARQSFGALPRVNWNMVPEPAVVSIREKLETLEDDFQKAAVESVVDRAREAATAILSAFLQQQKVAGAKGKDLMKLIELLSNWAGKHEQRVVACAGEIAARLHSRGKHAEQESRGVRALREQDAQLAVQCVGVMLCDLGWGDWA